MGDALSPGFYLNKLFGGSRQVEPYLGDVGSSIGLGSHSQIKLILLLPLIVLFAPILVPLAVPLMFLIFLRKLFDLIGLSNGPLSLLFSPLLWLIKLILLPIRIIITILQYPLLILSRLANFILSPFYVMIRLLLFPFRIMGIVLLLPLWTLWRMVTFLTSIPSYLLSNPLTQLSRLPLIISNSLFNVLMLPLQVIRFVLRITWSFFMFVTWLPRLPFIVISKLPVINLVFIAFRSLMGLLERIICGGIFFVVSFIRFLFNIPGLILSLPLMLVVGILRIPYLIIVLPFRLIWEVIRFGFRIITFPYRVIINIVQAVLRFLLTPNNTGLFNDLLQPFRLLLYPIRILLGLA